MTVFETPGPVRLDVAIGPGEVLVEAAEEGQVTVDVEPYRDDETARATLEDMILEAREHGGRHEVLVRMPAEHLRKRGGGVIALGSWKWSFGSLSVRVTVRVPPGTDVSVATSSGDVDLVGQLGIIDVKTVSGDVVAEEIGGGKVSAVSGDVRVATAHGDLDLHAVSGDLRVGEAFGSLALKTVSGDETVESLSAGPVRLQSVSGDVRVGVAPGLALWLDAASLKGSMQSELEVSGEAPDAEEPGQVVELRARTVSGDVRITRAASVPLS